MTMTRRLEKKFLYNKNIKKGTTTKQEAGDNSVKTPKWETQKQEDNYNCNDSLPKWEGSEPHFEIPSQGILYLEDEEPK